jgi:hypothetical protein
MLFIGISSAVQSCCHLPNNEQNQPLKKKRLLFFSASYYFCPLLKLEE